MRIEERDGAWLASGPERQLCFVPGAAKTLAFAAFSVADAHILEESGAIDQDNAVGLGAVMGAQYSGLRVLLAADAIEDARVALSQR